MQARLHFISGLPRSGSTLLSAILRQNPAFQATITSPVGSLYMALETGMCRRNESSVLIDGAQRRAILRGIFSAYYEAFDSSRVVFDTNRLWCARMPALAGLFPEARVICCVRPIPWVIDSFERLAIKNPYELSGLFAYEAGSTVYTRAKRVSASDGVVGYALDALREAYFGDFFGRLILIDYEALSRAPGMVMEKLYGLLGEPAFAHDFENVAFQTDTFDEGVGTPGLHAVRQRVEWRPRETVLPPDLFATFVKDSFWLRPGPRFAKVTGILAKAREEGVAMADAAESPPRDADK